MSYFLQLKVSDLLQQCSFKQLKQIHAIIVTTSLDRNIQIVSKFLRRSTEFGGMEYPDLIFSQMGGIFCAEITFWNAMIRGYAYNGPLEKCISMYDEMPQRGLRPNNFTYPYVLSTCSELGWYKIGTKVHCQVLKTGFEYVFSVANSIFHFYVRMADFFEGAVDKRKKINDIRKIFDDMRLKPIELWNRMISVYVGIGDVERARQIFDDMSERDVVSWNSVISGYVRVGDVKNARNLFERMPEKNVVSWTSMVGAYASCGDFETAKEFFTKMPERNVVSWNSMISAYTKNGKFKEALNIFSQMELERMDLDGFTFVSALSACSQLGALDLGKWIHYLIKDWPKLGIIVGTALIEMYAKCGDVNKAFTIFIKIGNKDVFCFNVMIRSLAINGRIEDAIKIFYLMQRRGIWLNDFSFTGALFACSHGGLLEEGRKIFYSMDKNFGISPKLEHYGCMVDLLSRSGQLEEAQHMMREMPFQPDTATWGALLGGCRVRSDLKLAENVIETIGKAKANEAGVYVLLSNIYASEGQWLEASSAREEMEQKNIKKKTGFSSVISDVHDGYKNC